VLTFGDEPLKIEHRGLPYVLSSEERTVA
jgi:hypothetical protein